MKLIGTHNFSTWMTVAALIGVATMTRPNLLAFLMIPLIGCWLFFTREVARREVARPLCKACVGIALVVSVGVIFLMTKISWIAL